MLARGGVIPDARVGPRERVARSDGIVIALDNRDQHVDRAARVAGRDERLGESRGEHLVA